MAAVDLANAKFAKRCPRCGNDEWRIGRLKRTCTKCLWQEDFTTSMPPNAFYEWKGTPEQKEQLKKELAEGKDEKIIRIPSSKWRAPEEELIPVPPPGTAGYVEAKADQERIKQKALNAPTDHANAFDVVCNRCSRQMTCNVRDKESYVCPTCLLIEKFNGPLKRHGAWSTPPTSASHSTPGQSYLCT